MIRYFFVQTAVSIMRTPLVQLIAISTITVSLTVLCSLFTLTRNLDDAMTRWNRGLGIIAFMEPGLSTEHVHGLADQVRGWSEVSSVAVHDRETAMTDLRKMLGERDDVTRDIDPKVLPISLEIAVRTEFRTEQGRDTVATKLRRLPKTDGVEIVDFGRDLISRMKGVAELVSIASLVIGLLTLSAVVFIVTNTVRLTLYARREELEIMELVGATRLFIRVPFYLEGALQGFIGASCALALTWLLLQAVPTTGLLNHLARSGVQLAFISGPVCTMIIALSASVGVLASHLATAQFLSRRHG
ncbi:MAG: ABC transporter permease [Myxococcota bacterium]|nr:ABC transporter permease [Myxococcota bacterium]